MKSKTTNLIELNLAVLIWGGTAMFAKGIALPLSHIMCVRYLFCAVSLLFFLFALRIPVRLERGKDYAVVAIVGILLCFNGLTLFKALRISTAAIAILSFYTYPVFTALLEPFVFGEKLRTSDIALAGFILVGILIMTPQFNFSNSTTQGVMLGVLSGLIFMARSLIIRKYVQEISSSVFMFWQAMVIGLILIPWLFF
jgi:drug/metabolite transporter (DMT)-like permease